MTSITSPLLLIATIELRIDHEQVAITRSGLRECSATWESIIKTGAEWYRTKIVVDSAPCVEVLNTDYSQHVHSMNRTRAKNFGNINDEKYNAQQRIKLKNCSLIDLNQPMRLEAFMNPRPLTGK